MITSFAQFAERSLSPKLDFGNCGICNKKFKTGKEIRSHYEAHMNANIKAGKNADN